VTIPGTIRAGITLALAACWLSGTAEGVEPDAALPTDPRVIEANSLLSDENARDRAIELYGQVLAEDPDEEMARMWLARVLSWDGRYDEALAHYDRFLIQAEPPPWAEVERAEVLSWAGRYDEAERGFQTLLARDPEDARAALGLARVYKWSGRHAEAVKLYEQSLAFEGNTEARRELAEVRSQLGGHSEGDTQVFRDSDDFELTEVSVSGAMDVNLRTRVIGQSGYVRVNSDDESFSEDRAQGFDARAGVEHRPAPGLVTRVQAGGRRWDHANDSFLANGELEYTWNDRLATGASLDYGDFLAESHSIGALVEDVDHTTGRAWAWSQLLPRVAGYAYFQGGYLSDSNGRVAGGASIDFRPFDDWDVGLSLALGVLSYTGRSDFYYDPTLSTDGSLSLKGELRVHEHLALHYEAGTGYGFADQDGNSGHGFTWRVAGGPKISAGDFWLSATAHRAASRRSTLYETWGVGVNVGLGF
jgi:tetratricopeptide (TPR) repeat protein